MPILIEQHEYTTDYNTVRFRNLASMSLGQWHSQII